MSEATPCVWPSSEPHRIAKQSYAVLGEAKGSAIPLKKQKKCRPSERRQILVSDHRNSRFLSSVAQDRI